MLPLAHAPDLAGATRWRNVERPVDLRHDLAGQVVLLLFFTPECVHCRAALRAVNVLDLRFQHRPFAVIGIASPRWPVPDAVDALVAELALRFPIALDDERALWRAYECAAWPTLVLVDGTGRVRFHGCGEPNAHALTSGVQRLLAEVDFGGEVRAMPALPRVRPPRGATPLSYPGGLAFDPGRNRLWIADTARHRVLAFDVTSGALQLAVGGLPGAGDGDARTATFAGPQGLAFDASLDACLVADAGNHLLRAVAPDGTTTTLLGTGMHSDDRGGGARGVGQGLAAPWGLAAADEHVWIAMPGANQLWAMERATGVARAVVGSGVFGCDDGAATTARLGQPRAVAVRGEEVVFCDPIHDAVRCFDAGRGMVATLVGGAGPGDTDGPCATARFRQPEAVVWHGGDLIVADTGNGKLKRIDRARGVVETVLCGVELVRPAALVCQGERLWVADRARGAIVLVDLGTGAASELVLDVPQVAAPAGTVRLRSEADCVLRLPLGLPAGAMVHGDVPVRVDLANVVGKALVVDLEYEAQVEGDRAVLKGVRTGPPATGEVRATIRCAARRDVGSVVHVVEWSFVLGVEVAADAAAMGSWVAG